MIEGIHILNKTPIYETADWAETVFILSCVILVISFLTICDAVAKDFDILFCFGFVTLFVSAIVLFTIGFWAPEKETDRYRYEVIMDEGVSFEDIYSNYDVIEQRGEIWILEDKENDR